MRNILSAIFGPMNLMLIAIILALVIVRQITSSFWLGLLLVIVFAIVINYVFAMLWGLFDEDTRLANKLCIRIEYLSLYRQIFDKLERAEAEGKDTSWLYYSLPDAEEWMRYFKWRCQQEDKRKFSI